MSFQEKKQNKTKQNLGLRHELNLQYDLIAHIRFELAFFW